MVLKYKNTGNIRIARVISRPRRVWVDKTKEYPNYPYIITGEAAPYDADASPTYDPNTKGTPCVWDGTSLKPITDYADQAAFIAAIEAADGNFAGFLDGVYRLKGAELDPSFNEYSEFMLIEAADVWVDLATPAVLTQGHNFTFTADANRAGLCSPFAGTVGTGFTPFPVVNAEECPGDAVSVALVRFDFRKPMHAASGP